MKGDQLMYVFHVSWDDIRGASPDNCPVDRCIKRTLELAGGSLLVGRTRLTVYSPLIHAEVELPKNAQGLIRRFDTRNKHWYGRFLVWPITFKLPKSEFRSPVALKTFKAIPSG